MKTLANCYLAGCGAVALVTGCALSTMQQQSLAATQARPPATKVAPAWISLVPPAGTRPGGAPAGDAQEGYRLVWNDEFDKDGPLDPSNWGYESGFVRNQEAQYYQPENAWCKDGFLVIAAVKESRPNSRYNGPPVASTASTNPATNRGRGATRGGGTAWPNLSTINLTSASVNTRGKHEFIYGRFEIRAKIDTRAGSWPAFWTLGTSGGWPGNGEVDIMEYYRNMVLANVAWQGAGGAVWNSVRKPLSGFPKDFSDSFHLWRMDWDATSIRLFLDGVKINEQDLSRTVNTGGRSAGASPFVDRSVYLLLNQAIGGQNGGDFSQTQFPVYFYVDYVRVWQRTPAPGANGTLQTPAQ